MKWEFAPTKISSFLRVTAACRFHQAGVSTDGFKGGFPFPANTIPDGEGLGLRVLGWRRSLRLTSPISVGGRAGIRLRP